MVPAVVVNGTHDSFLVALSIVVAILASFTGLSLASRIRASRGRARTIWGAAAAIALGGGIWSMHFVAMLAFVMPGMPMTYDVGPTLVSLAVAIAFTGAGFAAINWHDVSRRSIVGAGVLIGSGAVAMHYIGMAAMRMPAMVRYDPIWVGISIVIALLAATTATWLACREQRIDRRLLAAIVMGIAIAGMHYAGMHAAIFTMSSGIDAAAGRTSLDQAYMAVGISCLTILILSVSLGAVQFERIYRRAARREARATLRLTIADILRGQDADAALHDVAALLGAHFDVVRAGFGDLDTDTDAFDYRVCWADGTVQPLIGQLPAAAFGVKIVAALNRGETVVIDDLFGSALTDDHTTLGTARQVDTRAILVVPFVRHGQLRTIVYLNDRRPRHWRPDEIAFMEEVAERIRVVIERVAAEQDLRALNASLEERVEARTRELRQVQEALHHVQKMEAIGQLTGGVAHGFNNLLTPIMGALDRLNHKQMPDPRDARLIAGALQSAERAKTLVGRLLAFARRQPLRLQPVDVPVLVRGMTDLIAGTIGPTIHMAVDAAPDVGCALADPNQLEMALLNLSVNARDAMPHGGQLRISVDMTVAGASVSAPVSPGRYVRLSVADTGTGMDAETQRRAIEPFFSTKGVGRGTGLGLSMAHGLAAQLGGALTIDSALGRGTRICLWLPECSAGGLSAASVEPSETTVFSGTAIRVDDEDVVREATAQMLSDLGFRVRCYASAADALSAIDDEGEQAPGLVVSDQVMPGMTGAEFLGHVRARYPRVRTLLISGYSDWGDIDPAIPRLTKPFVKRDLAAALAVIR
ncbi:MHYT domain-containing protein [uncultured Sphingomonas sp.]|uniref:MHYT domain-containing protein n=1 Tax=uncultured Sphingomonas sp. TaxID=158754 RepID=UPI0037492E2B